jgi:hypothetical protein
MPTERQVSLTLTPTQFLYLQAAVRRDLENLEDMAPWDIDDNIDAHAAQVRMCKVVGRMFDAVEQTQVHTH